MSSWANCQRKVKCKTVFHALIACWRMKRRNPHAAIVAYECEYCHNWHIGNRFNKTEARKVLNRLTRMMAHPNFHSKAPADIREHLIWKKARMEGFLRVRRGEERMESEGVAPIIAPLRVRKSY